jgi:hypothetical protein
MMNIEVSSMVLSSLKIVQGKGIATPLSRLCVLCNSSAPARLDSHHPHAVEAGICK